VCEIKVSQILGDSEDGRNVFQLYESRVAQYDALIESRVGCPETAGFDIHVGWSSSKSVNSEEVYDQACSSSECHSEQNLIQRAHLQVLRRERCSRGRTARRWSHSEQVYEPEKIDRMFGGDLFSRELDLRTDLILLGI
jgi:hypothetical protein